jgi:hypothetical protein
MLFTARSGFDSASPSQQMSQTIEKHRLMKLKIARSRMPRATAIGGGGCVKLIEAGVPAPVRSAATVGRAGAGSSMEWGEVPKVASCRIGFNSSEVLGFWKPGSTEDNQERKTGLWLWAHKAVHSTRAWRGCLDY